MIFPDWTAAINSQINAFLNWSSLAQPLQIVIGTAVSATVVGLFLSVFLRGR